MFQYISCYSLSVSLSFGLYEDRCFNTSHVTLYHPLQNSSLDVLACFNTSHVTLYQNIWIDKSDILCFNTSHVTLYRRSTRLTARHTGVSIHLMLLFIRMYRCTALPWSRFNTSHVTLYLKVDAIFNGL